MSLPSWPPSWWPSGGVHNLTDAANTIRNAFFAGLGSLEGFPYNPNIVQGGSVVAQPANPQNVPAGTIGLCEIVDPNGNLVGEESAIFGGGAWTFPFPKISIDVTLAYQVSVWIYPASSNLVLAATSWSANGLAVHNGVLWGGSIGNFVFPEVAQGMIIQVFVENAANGEPPSGVFGIQLNLQDLSQQQQGQQGYLSAGGGSMSIVLGKGVFKAPGSVLPATDQISATIALPGDKSWTVASGAVQFTAAQAAAGTLRIKFAVMPATGVAPGSPGSVTFQFTGTSEGPSQYANVGVQVWPQGQDPSVTGIVSGQTGNSDRVAIAIPSSWVSLALSYGYQSPPVNQVTEQGPIFEGSGVVGATPASITNGTAQVNVQVGGSVA